MSALVGFGFVAIFGLGVPTLLGLVGRAQYKAELAAKAAKAALSQ